MSKKHKKVYVVLNYIEHLHILGFTVIGCVSNSAFSSSFGIPVGITSSPLGLKICVITVGIKKYKSTIKKKKKKHDNIVLLAKSKLSSIEVIIYKALIDSNITHNEFVSVNNVLKEYDDMTEEMKNLETLTVHRRF